MTKTTPAPDSIVWIAIACVILYAAGATTYALLGNNHMALICGAWLIFWIGDLIYVRRRQLRLAREDKIWAERLRCACGYEVWSVDLDRAARRMRRHKEWCPDSPATPVPEETP